MPRTSVSGPAKVARSFQSSAMSGRRSGSSTMIAVVVATMSPHPAAVVELGGVVQDPAPQRRLGAGRVELHRPFEQLVEAREGGRPAHEVVDRLGLLAGDARRDVDQHHPLDQIGTAGGECDRREPAERHPDDQFGGGRERVDHRRQVVRVGGRCRADPGCGAVGVAVAREVGGDQRARRAPSRRCPRCGRSARRRGSGRGGRHRSPTAGC